MPGINPQRSDNRLPAPCLPAFLSAALFLVSPLSSRLALSDHLPPRVFRPAPYVFRSRLRTPFAVRQTAPPDWRGKPLPTPSEHHAAMRSGHYAEMPFGHDAAMPSGHNAAMRSGHNAAMRSGHNAANRKGTELTAPSLFSALRPPGRPLSRVCTPPSGATPFACLRSALRSDPSRVGQNSTLGATSLPSAASK